MSRMARQLMCISSGVTMAVVSAAEAYAPAKKMPLAVPRAALRNPARHDARHTGPGAGLSRAEQEAHRQQRVVAGRGRGAEGEHRPPAHDACEHGPGAAFVGPARGGDFEQGVGQREGGKHPAHLRLVEAELRGDRGRHGANAGSVEVSDHGERHHEHEYHVTRARRGLRFDQLESPGRDCTSAAGQTRTGGPSRDPRPPQLLAGKCLVFIRLRAIPVANSTRRRRHLPPTYCKRAPKRSQRSNGRTTTGADEVTSSSISYLPATFTTLFVLAATLLLGLTS